MKSIEAKKKGGRPTKRPESKAFLLNLYENYTAREIAHIYKVSQGTVYSWISRIRAEQARETQTTPGTNLDGGYNGN